MNKRYIMLIVIFILCIILGVTLYCSFSDNNKNKNKHKSTTEKLFQTADECAEEGQDIYNPNLFPSAKHPLRCCNNQEAVLTNNKYICPPNNHNSAIISGKFPVLKKFNLTLDEFDVQEMSDMGSTNSCAKYTKDGVFERDGNIVLKVSKLCGKGKCIHSGRMNSKDAFKYGIFEIDAKVPKCNEVFPAIWLLPVTEKSYGNWPCQGEIDIMETTDTMPWSTFNIVSGQGRNTNLKGQSNCSSNDCNNCYPYCLNSTIVNWSDSRLYVESPDCKNKSWSTHKFVLYWEPGRLISYVDPEITKDSNNNIIKITPSDKTDPNDKSVKSYKEYKFEDTEGWIKSAKWAQNCYSKATKYAPFDTKMNLMFNIAIGGYGGSKCSGGNMSCSDNNLNCKDSVGSEMVISKIIVHSIN